MTANEQESRPPFHSPLRSPLTTAKPPAALTTHHCEGASGTAHCSFIILLFLLTTSALAQGPLYEEEPFDRITLNATNQNAVLDVRRLTLPDGVVPDPLPKSGNLVVELLDRPGRTYQIPWFTIVKVELFEQMVLADANRRVADAARLLAEALPLQKAGQEAEASDKRRAAESKLDAAYDYFTFLEENYPQTPGLDAAMQQFLFREAIASNLKGQYDGALAMLRELYARNPDWPGLDSALAKMTERLVHQYTDARDFGQRDYRSARQLVLNLAAWFPEHPGTIALKSRLQSEAAKWLARAETNQRTGRYAEAGRDLRTAMAIWPELPKLRETALLLHEKHPRVTVGVSVPAVDLVPGSLIDGAARRSGRLVYRTLTEFAAAGPNGGRYVCPIGEIGTENPLRLTLRIRPGLRFASGETALSGYDVSRRLLAMADPGDPAYRDDWADLFYGVTVENAYELDVELRRTHVRPDALLQTVLVPYTSPGALQQPLVPNGPYRLPTSSEGELTYQANSHYAAAGEKPPREIAERYFPAGAKAIAALRRGEIHVIDRVNPWDLAGDGRHPTLKDVSPEEHLTVAPYALPLVHCLIPNLRKPLLSQRTFRRALVYGINRRAILDQLGGGQTPAGARLVSGPFPPGQSDIDPIGYACNPTIKARRRAYDPRLALALAEVGLRDAAEALAKQEPESKGVPQLVLAHPPHEIARVACLSIQRQLGLIGIPIALRELEGPPPKRIPSDIDLLYAELAMWEPAVDARRLLGPHGIAGECSPYMSLALRKLEEANDWDEVVRALHAIHRIAHDDVAVVPLWQLTDYFAYREELTGIGTRPVTLYENVEQWQLDFRFPGESE